MRSKKEIFKDNNMSTWSSRAMVELLADLRDEQVSLNKTLSALLLECYGVEAIDRVMAGEHPKEVKHD